MDAQPSKPANLPEVLQQCENHLRQILSAIERQDAAKMLPQLDILRSILLDIARYILDNATPESAEHIAAMPWPYNLALFKLCLWGSAGKDEQALNDPARHTGAWNFGPQNPQPYSVRQVCEMLAAHWKKAEIDYQQNPLPETVNLALDSSKARERLGWMPAWDIDEIIMKTAAWYRDYYADPARCRAITETQLQEWRAALRRS